MNTKTITRLGFMLALVITLTALEQALPPIPFLPPGVKPGFSHVVTLFCVFHVGKGQAILLAVLKSLFVLLTRGLIAALLSFAGGILSLVLVIVIMVIAATVFSSPVPYITAGVIGAVTHNVAQLGVYSLLIRVNMIYFYIPVLIISGIIAGIITGALAKALTPFLMHLY